MKHPSDADTEEQKSVPIVKKTEHEQKAEEARKQKFKQDFVKLIGQIKNGCSKDICANSYCMKNPISKYPINEINNQQFNN